MKKLMTAAVLAVLVAGMTATSAVAANGDCRELTTLDDPLAVPAEPLPAAAPPPAAPAAPAAKPTPAAAKEPAATVPATIAVPVETRSPPVNAGAPPRTADNSFGICQQHI